MKTKRKNIFKSLLALTLVLIMVLGVAPLSEFAGVDWASLFAPKAEAAEKSIVYVETLTPTNSARYTGNQGDSCMGKIGIRNGTVGVTGTAYTHGLEAWVARWNGTEEKSWVWNEYAIDGKYNRLTGIIDFCHYSFDGWDYTKYPHTTQFEVLGDGKVLYSKVLDSNISTYPIDLNVDVTGVSVLKIYFYDLEASKVGSSFLLGNLALSKPGSNSDTLDTDGDGLPDVWEKEGLDYDGDGKIDVDLPAMGADPNVPDIFVEVDWMVRPQKKILWWEISKYRNLAPSEDAMKLVYDSFKQHGINLHIDVGPDSIDFVTGKKWGKLSGGNEIPYEKKFNIKSSWNSTVNANFSKARHNVFKHCLFVDQYDGVRSGIANNIPGQFFIVANQDWVFNGGNISVGGTFMHELGHTLGLRHGGCDHEHYKPNYLSVMNYAFQTTGLVGSGMVGYSDYKLPDINEAHINENLGIDPSGLTAGTGLGTTLFYWAPNQRNVIPISKAAIDFNNNGKLETDISLDLNPDGNVYDKPIAELKGHEDWSGIVYKGGAIGEHNNSSNGNSSGIAFPINDTGLQEKTLEESLKTSTLASSGTGYIELLPSSLITDLNGQSLEFEVGNMSANETTFTVNIQCKSLFDSYTKSITISGSKDKIESERVIVPITKNVSSGEYTITCSLVSDDKSSDYTFSQEAVQVDKEDIEEMKKLLSEENELTDEEVSKIESVIEKYENAESNNICKLCGKNHGISFFGKLTAFFHSVVYFLADILTAPFKLIIKLIKAIIGLFR